MNIQDKSVATARWLEEFAEALDRGDLESASALFAETSYWRDLVAFTWNIVTFEGRAAVADMLKARLADVRPRSFVVDGSDGWFSFETEVGRGRGHLRLKEGKAWTFFTALTELKGFEERTGLTREMGTEHGAVRNRVTWTDQRKADAELGLSHQPFVLIVGGGQGGMGLGARLKRLGVPALIVDRHPRPGDAWRKRYKSLCLHDPVWYDHLPYLPFPDHWPVYTPKDKMGDWLESYARIMELDYWSSTACQRAKWDEAKREWTVEVEREGRPITLRPRHLVLATGMSGFPEVPQFPGADRFKGKQHHSSQHAGGEGWGGRRCVVVGSNNSAHDIAADLWEHGADVTLLQRSPTLVARSETLARIGRPLYSEEAVRAGITTELADFTAASWPFALQPQAAKPVTAQMKKDDAGFYARLAAAGFMLTFGEDETGIGQMYMRRGSGYYIDVGASELIADGRIKLRSGVEVDRLTETAVVLDDGSELPADLVVYATGYGSMNQWAAALISQDVADKVGKCWGLGSGTAKDPGPWEGELRNMWKPTAQEGLWFHGGNLAQSRHYSRYLALQLKARLEGLATPIYGRGPVHHRV
jgi:putative flavoprotein involved in K+ transport